MYDDDGSPAEVRAENGTQQITAYYCYGGLGKFVLDGHVVFGA